jgi:hypothetical protein
MICNGKKVNEWKLKLFISLENYFEIKDVCKIGL